MRLAKLANCLAGVCLLCLTIPSSAADLTISDVVNAGNRIPSGFPSYGVAQGSLFAIIGTGLGPDQSQQASFPLPTTDGLAGVTVQVAVGGTTVNAIMVYAWAYEVGAILPSSTPTGTGTVTINNNGLTATAPITVVLSAFGAFSLDYYSGTQAAAAFNIGGDGSTTLNYLSAPGQSAQPGQDVLISGTGLGAISSDETQSGATDVPQHVDQAVRGNQARRRSVGEARRGASVSGRISKLSSSARHCRVGHHPVHGSRWNQRLSRSRCCANREFGQQLCVDRGVGGRRPLRSSPSEGVHSHSLSRSLHDHRELSTTIARADRRLLQRKTAIFSNRSPDADECPPSLAPRENEE